MADDRFDYDAEIDLESLMQVARVRSISDDGHTAYFELRNGQYATGETTARFELTRGTVVLISEDKVVPAPPDTWPEESMIGVVRLKGEHQTLVDISGHLRLVPTCNAVEYRVGNTVEIRSGGVVQKLADDPIRHIDLSIDETFISQFVSKPGTGSPTFEDFGGDQEIVARAKELVETPLRYHDELAAIGARPIKGVLFTGPPGTGKTMLGRIIAASAGATFYKISGPEIVSKWLGQSEEILRRIFEHAATQSRAIVFFDEIDSLAVSREGDAHEATRRLVAQLLILMDGFETKDRIVVIATTNRPKTSTPLYYGQVGSTGK